MKQFLRTNGAWLGFLVLAVILTIWTGGDFLSPRNLTNLIRQASINGILAAGMTVIILTGGIDLSIGSIVALCGVIVGVIQVNHGYADQGFTGLVLTMLAAMIAGLAIGLINGVLIAKLRLAPFVITLGMMVIARGLALILSGGSSISPMGESMNDLAGGYFSEIATVVILILAAAGIGFGFWKRRKESSILDFVFPTLAVILFGQSFLRYKGFPNLALFLVVVVGATWTLLNRTVFGRSTYALGSNEKAAYWAGVSIKKVKIIAYGMMGLFAGLAAVLLTGRLNGADPNAGQLFELDAIAAVVIGGVSLKGGVGSVAGSLIGALTMATLNNGMDLLGVSSFYQMVFKGLIIILAVSLDRNQREA
ncbi:MAG: inner-membrane translocator [Bdellovibrionaceae bacterium]|nr:inner-membrane translocator [Pseudobdellovibrionaceae bacterium]